MFQTSLPEIHHLDSSKIATRKNVKRSSAKKSLAECYVDSSADNDSALSQLDVEEFLDSKITQLTVIDYNS